jgi:cell division protein FtsB
MVSALYDFCRDQGAIIAGLLALAAGYLVFRGATRAADRQVAALTAQTEALRQQNHDLRDEGQRRRARDETVATKLVASVLTI